MHNIFNKLFKKPLILKYMIDCIIVHYDEIGLKGKNRSKFELLLINNIERKAKDFVESVKRDNGQITVNLAKGKDYHKLGDILKSIPGIAYLSYAEKCSLDISKIESEVVNFLKEISFETFKIDTRRHDKSYELNSMDVNSRVGAKVVEKLNKKVKLKNPDALLKIEITHKNSFISIESVEGVGGLPTDPKQKVVALLSGGFDSPVASYMMMRRGCSVILAHFKNENQKGMAVENKIIDLAKQLSKFQIKTILYIIPFEKLQKEIILKCKSEFRMLIYRRFMLRIASLIAKQNNARFVVTGDSLSQVASQTIENLEATYKSSDKHVLSPLIGINKREILDISKQIGTYDISKQPYSDCCTYFLPKHPVLNAKSEELDSIESNFDVDILVSLALKSAEVKEFR